MKYLQRVEPKNYKYPIRTILNFVRYTGLIRQIYYKDKDRDMLAELKLKTANYGFSRGVEIFWTQYHARQDINRNLKKQKLRAMANNMGTELEDIQMAKKREQRAKEQQEQQRLKIEQNRIIPYETGYKPTVEELLKRNPFTERKAEGITYSTYHVKEKGAWVCLFIFEDDRKPLILSGSDHKKVTIAGFNKWLEVTEGKEIKTHYKAEQVKQKAKKPKSNQNADLGIDISHVERAMGITPDNPNNEDISDINDNIDDMLNDLFR